MALLSTTKAAKFLGVDSSTLRKWRSEGKGPMYYRMGVHTFRYDEADLQKWLKALATHPVSKAALIVEAIKF